MKIQPSKLPKRYQPDGFQIIHEDLDIIVGSKEAGMLTVAALWNEDETVESALNKYVKKGNSRSNKRVYVVHRLDQATSGALVFAKTEKVQNFLKDNWFKFQKTYYTVVHGNLKKKSGLIESHLAEDEDYTVASTPDAEQGKWARTEYEVLAENTKYSLLKINLLTGKKNQIRVHFSEAGHAVVGDTKYGLKNTSRGPMALHSYSLEINHPHKGERVRFVAPVPAYFNNLVHFKYKEQD